MYSVPKLAEYSAAALDAAVRELESALRQETGDTEQRALSGNLTENQLRELLVHFRDRWLARKHGVLACANEMWLRAAPPEAKKLVGERLNQVKTDLQPFVERLEFWCRQSPQALRSVNAIYSDLLQAQELGKRFREMPEIESSGGTHVGGTAWVQFEQDLTALVRQSERVDISLPGIKPRIGGEHPIIRTMNEIVAVFKAMGYSVEEGPEIESDYFNFEALNFPPNHPARDTQDTIFIAGQEKKPQRERLLLRTHTSPVQIRSMMKQPPPIRVVCPGRVYRHDAPDATHSPMFHQLECLAVDTNITLRDLKGTLDHAIKLLFGSDAKTKFQPSFFPFTEPSAEVYFQCPFCGGKGCRICKRNGWIELGGCGMVHPNVFKAVQKYGYDPEKVSGFAFGMGLDRMAALRWDVDDIQQFFHGDVRFLEQFA